MIGPSSYRGIAAAAFLLPALLGGCASVTESWQAPEVAVTAIRPQQLTLQQQTMQVGLKIRNPNDRTLPIKAMTYRLSLEGREIATGGGVLDRQIPAFGEETVDVSVVGDGAGLVGMLPALALQSRPWRYKIAGTATVAGVLPLPYSYSGEIDAQSLLRQSLYR